MTQQEKVSVTRIDCCNSFVNQYFPVFFDWPDILAYIGNPGAILNGRPLWAIQPTNASPIKYNTDWTKVCPGYDNYFHLSVPLRDMLIFYQDIRFELGNEMFFKIANNHGRVFYHKCLPFGIIIPPFSDRCFHSHEQRSWLRLNHGFAGLTRMVKVWMCKHY